MAEDLIGNTYPTPKGGTLYVVSSGERTSYYNVVCSICHKDQELFPEPLEIYRHSLIKGNIPCKCSPSGHLTERQKEIHIKRICIEVNYNYLGYIGDYLGSKTRLILECPIHGVWDTMRYGNFVNTGYRCELCSREKRHTCARLSDNHWISKFKETGNFPSHTFKRDLETKASNQTYSYWFVTCSLCSVDEYTNNGLCSGVFKSSSSHLSSGKVPCRCSLSYRSPPRHRDFKARDICNKEGLTFIEWEGKITSITNKTKLKWICAKGHQCVTTAHKFIKEGHRCNTCRKEMGNGNGYFKERANEKDFLYIMDFKDYIKVGRSFKVDKRRGNFKKHTTNNINVKNTYTSIHDTIYSVEQDIHKRLNNLGYSYSAEDWSTELFTKECIDVLYDIIKDYKIKQVT